MKHILTIIISSLLLSSTALSQWWVDGGNLIWPHGNVSITNGSLYLSSMLTDGNFILADTNGFVFNINAEWNTLTIKDDAIDLVNRNGNNYISGTLDASKPNISIGDWVYDFNGTGINLNVNNQTIKLQSQKTITIGDGESYNNGTDINLDDENQRITLDALKILLSAIPSDSTSVSTGELWFNSTTGAIHRKF